MEEQKQLITVEQIPVIKQKLEIVKEQIKQKVDSVLELECTEDTVKEIKQARADLNKDLKIFEEQRKMVKEQVFEPYKQFEDIYKEYISDQYKNADVILKGRINIVEDNLKSKRIERLKEYFTEYRNSLEIDFVEYENMNLNVTLSASEKSLKTQINEFLDKIKDDIELINTQEYSTEIMVEYKQKLNVSKAIQTVLTRKEMLKKEAEKLAKQEESKQEIKVEETTNTVEAPVVEKDDTIVVNEIEMFEVTFTVKGSREQLKELKEAMNEIGIERVG